MLNAEVKSKGGEREVVTVGLADVEGEGEEDSGDGRLVQQKVRGNGAGE